MGLTEVGGTPLSIGPPTQGWRATTIDTSDRVLSRREVLTLLVIGCLERNPGPYDEVPPFHCSIQPLYTWLDQKNFVYKIAAYQRGYEWRKEQISRLLEDLQQLMCGEYKVIKLSEVFVFQPPEKDAESQDRLNSPEWYKDSQRQVEIVDGQQRITTFILLYAVIQYWLFRIRKDLSSEDWKDAEARAKNLAARFTVRSVGKPLLLGRDKQNVQVNSLLEDDMFQDDCRFGKYLDKDEKIFEVEHENALDMSRWISEKIKEEKDHKDKLKWLIRLLDVLDNRVYWTTTLTTDAALALTTFVTHNSSASMVPLNQIDVIKVAIVSNIKDNSGYSRRSTIIKNSLEHWNSARDILAGVIKKYDEKTKPRELPFATLLLTNENSGDKASLLMVDLLNFVRTILVCDSSSEGYKVSKQLGLEEFYGHLRALYLRGGTDTWDAVEHMKITRHCALALAILLKQEGLNPSLQLTISNLLGFHKDYQDWRPLGIAIIGSLNKKLEIETYPKSFNKTWQTAAGKAFKAIEMMVTCFAAMECANEGNIIQIKENVYNDIITWVLNFGMKALCEGIHSKVIERLKKHNLNITSDVNLYIVEKFYFAKNVYSRKKDIGRTLLLMLEHQLRLPHLEANANISVWRKELTVEHILPQDPLYKEQSDIDFPDGKRQNVLNMLGNLTLLTRRDNAAFSNRYWKSTERQAGKREMLQTEGYDDSIKLNTKLLEAEEYQEWRWQEFLLRHTELLGFLAKKFGITDEKWKKNSGKWKEELEKQYAPSHDGAGKEEIRVEQCNENLKWSKDPAGFKAKLGAKLDGFLKSLAEAISDIDSNGEAWAPRNSDDVRERMLHEYPDIVLENEEIAKARRDHMVLHPERQKSTYKDLRKETQAFLDAKLQLFVKIEKCIFIGNKALSDSQRKEFQRTILEFCVELDYAECYAILDLFGPDIIKSREKVLDKHPGKKKLKKELTKVRGSNNQVLLRKFELLLKQYEEQIGPVRFEAPPSQSQEDAPSQSQEDALSQSQEDAPSQSQEDAPSQSQEDALSQSQEDALSQSQEDALSQSQEDAPSQSQEDVWIDILENSQRDGLENFLKKQGLKDKFSKSLDDPYPFQCDELVQTVMAKIGYRGFGNLELRAIAAIDLINHAIEDGINVLAQKEEFVWQLQWTNVSVECWQSKYKWHYVQTVGGLDQATHDLNLLITQLFPVNQWKRGPKMEEVTKYSAYYSKSQAHAFHRFIEKNDLSNKFFEYFYTGDISDAEEEASADKTGP